MVNSEENNQVRAPQLIVVNDDAPEQPFTFHKLIPLGFNVFVTDNERNARSMGILQQEVLRRYGTESHAEPKNKEDGVEHEEKSAMVDKEMEESSKDEDEEESETETEDNREEANLGIDNRDGSEATENEEAQSTQKPLRNSHSCIYPLLARKYNDNENSDVEESCTMETDFETDFEAEGEADDEADEEIQRSQIQVQRAPGLENDPTVIIISDEDENDTDSQESVARDEPGYGERFEQSERRPVEGARIDESRINAEENSKPVEIIEISDDEDTEENSESSEIDEGECTNMITSGGGAGDGDILMAQRQRALESREVGENEESDTSDDDAQSQGINYQQDCNYSVQDMDISEEEVNDEDEMTTESSESERANNGHETNTEEYSHSEGDSEVARINESALERCYYFRFLH